MDHLRWTRLYIQPAAVGSCPAGFPYLPRLIRKPPGPHNRRPRGDPVVSDPTIPELMIPLPGGFTSTGIGYLTVAPPSMLAAKMVVPRPLFPVAGDWGGADGLARKELSSLHELCPLARTITRPDPCSRGRITETYGGQRFEDSPPLTGSPQWRARTRRVTSPPLFAVLLRTVRG